MTGIGLFNLWLWLDGKLPDRPPQGPRTGQFWEHGTPDPLFALRPAGRSLDTLRRARVTLDQKLRQ